MSKIDDLVYELVQLSPMPDDSDITPEIMSKYEAVVKEIAAIKDSKSILPLINSFGYGYANGLYWLALHTLEMFEIDQVDPLLVQSLSKGERGTRMWASYMLGRSKNVTAVAALKNLLRDENELVRQNAVMALGMIDSKE